MDPQELAEFALACLRDSMELHDHGKPTDAAYHAELARTQALVAIALALSEIVGKGGWLDWLYPTKASGDDTPF